MMQTKEKVKTTTAGGRKRKHLVKFFLNNDEYEKLCKDAVSVRLYFAFAMMIYRNLLRIIYQAYDLICLQKCGIMIKR